MPWASSSSWPCFSSVPQGCSRAPNASDEAHCWDPSRRRCSDCPVLDRQPVFPPRRHHGRHLRHPGAEPQSPARLHGSALARPRRVLRDRRVYFGAPHAAAGVVVLAGAARRRRGGRDRRLGDRAARPEAARRVLRARHDLVRRRRRAGEHQLDGADEWTARAAGRTSAGAGLVVAPNEDGLLLSRAGRGGPVLRRHPRRPGILPATRDRSHPLPLTLSVRDLTVRFGGVAALGGVSFDVRPGSITSLIGPNGAGKTTAFNAITGFLRPTRGLISYGGAVLSGLRPCDIARRGVVRTFQKTSVFPALTVLENVLTGLHLRGRAAVWSALALRRSVREEEATLRSEAETIVTFVGLAHRRGEVASALPYGEQRLVELAGALAAHPSILLLHEPARGMTGVEKDVIGRLIRTIRDQGITVLLVEHDMRVVMGLSDTVIVLNHGAVIAEGPPATVQSHPDVIRAYLGTARAEG